MNSLHINNLFWTVQGEGTNSGRRALFVRMPFCDLKCSWCDTEFDSYQVVTIEELEEKASAEPARFAVVTGGEPSMNKHTPLVVATLKSLDFEVAMETNGHFPIPAGVDWVTVSPKRDQVKGLPPYFVHADAWEKASEFKYVVDKGFDFSLLDRHHIADGKRLYLSPEFNGFKENLASIIDFQKRLPIWRISLQTHKFMEIP